MSGKVNTSCLKPSWLQRLAVIADRNPKQESTRDNAEANAGSPASFGERDISQ